MALVEFVVLFLFLPVHLVQVTIVLAQPSAACRTCLWKLELDHVEFFRRFIEQIWLVTFPDY